MMRWMENAAPEEGEKVGADAGVPAQLARSSMSVLPFGKQTVIKRVGERERDGRSERHEQVLPSGFSTPPGQQ